MARHGLILGQHGATVITMRLDMLHFTVPALGKSETLTYAGQIPWGLDILRQALNMQKQKGNYKKYMQNHPKPRRRRGLGSFCIYFL